MHESLSQTKVAPLSYSFFWMHKILKKTWKEEEKKSQSPASSHEGMANEHLRYTPPPLNTSADVEPNAVATGPSKYGHKRPRDLFESDPQIPALERPAKATRTGFADSIRNHLPEIVSDSKDRDDGLVPLPLGALKEQIFEQAKQQNSEYSLSPALFHISYRVS